MYVESMPGLALNAAVAEELSALREKSGHTFPEIAKAAGISVLTAKRYLYGQRGIPIDALGAIAYFLGGDPAEIVRTATARVQRND